jgi:signal transduction histidine kinase
MRSLALVFLSLYTFAGFAQTNSWERAQASKSASLDLYWYVSIPFIYKEKGKMAGLEVDLMEAFQKYLRQKHGVDAKLNWSEAKNFFNIWETVVKLDKPNVFGVSAFSITEERGRYVKFTNPYFSDITVLVSSPGTPIVRTLDEINLMMRDMVAVTIKGTTYEAFLHNLKRQFGMDFEMMYIDSDENILLTIGRAENRFGFIDLPIYLMLMKDGANLTRQNFFTVRGIGYGIIMPHTSDWNIPFNQFLEERSDEVAAIVSKYMGEEIYDFIENLYGEDQLSASILTKEKELQLELIKNANLKIQQEQASNRILVWGIVFISLSLAVIMILFINNQRANRLLIQQRDQIEEQRENIRQKNEQLMNRNAQLASLNEEKNSLVKILAHDLRAPISQITMISDLLTVSANKGDNGDAMLLEQIKHASERVNQMIVKILDFDALEGQKPNVIKEKVDTREILKDIADRYRPVAARKQMSFELGHCSSEFFIETDHLLLLQVLDNLVSNAIKFSSPNTLVTLKSTCSVEKVLFSVTDEGPGFTEEDKKLIFNRFQKLSAKPTSDESSTGLGLSIVKKYVEEMGGKVWLESDEGKGATFHVELPK